MSDDTGLGRVVLGLDGFALTEVELVGGEAWLNVASEPATVGCPDCGVVAGAHGRRARWLRDLPVAGRAAVWVWHKRVWRFHERLCGRATWTQRRDDVARPRFLLTERARAEICRQVARGRSVADLAASFGCGWHTAMNAVCDHGQPVVDDPARTADVAALGVDETTFTMPARGDGPASSPAWSIWAAAACWTSSMAAPAAP